MKISGWILLLFFLSSLVSLSHAAAWQSVGPNLVGEQVQDLDYNKQTRTLYAATASGLYKSTNRGDNWVKVSSPGRIYALEVVLTPNKETLYAVIDTSFCKSVDGGATWTTLGTTPPYSIHDIAFDGSGFVYLASDMGLYRSIDGGVTWPRVNLGTPALGFQVYSLDYDRINGALYAGTNYGVFKSLDQGRTWKQLFLEWITTTDPVTGRTITTSYHPRVHKVIAMNRTIYAAGVSSFYGFGFLYKSTDGGANWNITLPAVMPAITKGNLLSMALYTRTLTGAVEVYMGASSPQAGIYKTTNDGKLWVRSPSSRMGCAPVYDDIIDLIVAGNDLFAASWYGGVIRSADRGVSWIPVNNGLSWNPIITSVVPDPVAPSTLYATTNGLGSCEGVLKSTNAGVSWSIRNIYSPATGNCLKNVCTPDPIGELVVDPRTPSTLYAAGQNAFYISYDAGVTWQDRSKGLAGLSVVAVALDPVNSNILYTGTAGGGMFKSIDGGLTWTNIKTFPQTLTDVVVDPKRPRTIYASTASAVYKSVDGGVIWSKASSGITVPPGRFIKSLVMNPTTPSVIYAVVYQDGLYKTSNAAGTWTKVNAWLPLIDLAMDRNNPNLLYAELGNAVYVSHDGGITWGDPVSLSGIVFTPPFGSLFSIAQGGGLYVATYSDGIFKALDITPPVVTPPASITISSASPVELPASDPRIQSFLNGASALDGVDGPISVIQTSPNLPSFPVGTTTVTFTAVDKAGNTGKAVANITVVYIASPTALSAKAIDSHSVQLTWVDNSNNETGFLIYRQVGKGAKSRIGQVTANVTSFLDRNLRVNKVYRYYVEAMNAAGPSGQVSSTVRTLAQPAKLNAVVKKMGKRSVVILKWKDRVKGERGFIIQRKDGPRRWHILRRVRANIQTFTDRRVNARKVYRYRVQAFGRHSFSSWSKQTKIRVH